MDYGRWLLLLIAGVFICIVCTLENEDCIMALCLHIFFVIARYSQFFVSHTSLGCYDAVAANILCDLRPLQRQTEEYLCAFFCSLILYNLHDGAERKKNCMNMRICSAANVVGRRYHKRKEWWRPHWPSAEETCSLFLFYSCCRSY